MEDAARRVLRIGSWRVDASSGQISRDGETARLEVRTLRLLLRLAEHAGEVVSIDDLLDHVWDGVTVTPDSVYQAVTSLRRTLGDDPKQPTYIATVPRRGYRMVAVVTLWDEPSLTASDAGSGRDAQGVTSIPPTTTGLIVHYRTTLLLTSCVIVCLGLAASAWLFAKSAGSRRHAVTTIVAPQPQRSIAVLPFLDLTEGMKQGEFTDGMTEELIDKLSKLPDLRVPSPTSSFYFKDKQVSIPEVATRMGVAYILDGSVRKQGARLRVAARLVRADTGYVIWSQTYDRPWRYTLMVQDDIAGDVAEAVRASLQQAASPSR